MKLINVRELRAAIPRLKEALAAEQELVLISNGEPVARILPMQITAKATSLAAHRALMPMLPVSLESLIREERDRR
mgnify:CR=1 FL=1